MTTPRSRRPRYSTTISLIAEELTLLIDALDSHEYWQLTPENLRNNGTSLVSDGAEPEIDACRTLSEKLERAKARCQGRQE